MHEVVSQGRCELLSTAGSWVNRLPQDRCGCWEGEELRGRGGRTEIGCKEDLEDLRKAGEEWHCPSSPHQHTGEDEVRK